MPELVAADSRSPGSPADNSLWNCSIHYAHAYMRIMRADTCAHIYIKFVRRVEGEEAGVGQEGAGTGGVLKAYEERVFK